MVIFHSYVAIYQRVLKTMEHHLTQKFSENTYHKDYPMLSDAYNQHILLQSAFHSGSVVYHSIYDNISISIVHLINLRVGAISLIKPGVD